MPIFKRICGIFYPIPAISGAKVIVSTLGVNLKDCAPFASLHKSNLSEMDLLEWTTFYEKGLQFEGADKKTEALEAYLAANEIDDQYGRFAIPHCPYLLPR